MFTKMTGRFVLAVVAMIFGFLACNSFAAGEAEDLEMSAALAQIKLFAKLTDAEREMLKSVATLRRGKAGERIIQQGNSLDRMFIILEGLAEVRVNGKKFVTLSGQSLVGEIEFLDTLPATADVVLLKETNLIELNSRALIGLMEKHPRLGYILMHEIARVEAHRLRDTDQK